MKVAVIGASGIGRQHGKWFRLEGCEIVAFAGSSVESVARTTKALTDLFGFVGKGYVDVEIMLSETRPDIVAVASPPDLHHRHALAALTHGCHLYCEKPLVWDAKKSLDDMLREANEIRAAAEKSGKVLGINAQYVAAIPDYLALCGYADGEASYPESFRMVMESRGGAVTSSASYAAGGSASTERLSYESIWIDLASHPISLLMKWCPYGSVDGASVEFRVEQKRCHCRFDFVGPEGRRTKATIELGIIEQGPPARKFGINERIVEYEGRNDDSGVYRSYLKFEGREAETEDFMQRSVRAFLHALENSPAVPLVTGEEGVRNLEIQLQLLRFAMRV